MQRFALGFAILGQLFYVSKASFCLPIEIHDSWGDGWNGYYFDLYTGGTSLQSITLDDGSYDTDCLYVENDVCYTFSVSSIGSFPGEISYNLCGSSGDVYSEFDFCIDSYGSCSAEECSVELSMDDSWGDGWNGNYFGLFSDSGELIQSVTLASGSEEDMCLEVEPNNCYSFSLTTNGSWQSEVSWELCGTQGDISDTLDFCTDAQGQCVPQEPEESCDTGLEILQYDSFGDGWNGYEFSLFAEDGTLLQTVVLNDGSYGTDCLDVSANTCYAFGPSSAGSWANEISWDICGTTGYYDSIVNICLDSSLACSVVEEEEECNLEFSMMDSWGDGWNGNFFTLYSSSGESIQTVTLSDGSLDTVCLDVEPNNCYSIALSTTGSWAAEISWAVCGAQGLADDSFSFCIDSQGVCAENAPTLCIADADCVNGQSCVCVDQSDRKLEQSLRRRLQFGPVETCYCMY
eukprot:CAMPEP_0117745340 /NCGR_PEP_ID=MMETSP0947-20121206/7299_1 /TAXON_ID=44440 /ORGANISM="Chattonella subsalsa, Strain CCMP2191" /LENGTH=460 /DNA_ID=CAMNT_0005562467 /DNA_START=192 /DNA_END=1574 /DNA_ORIENTATION=+